MPFLAIFLIHFGSANVENINLISYTILKKNSGKFFPMIQPIWDWRKLFFS